MSYLVLARKYRPQQFGEVVGQAPVVRILQNALASDRVHHAFLFSGVRGVGKTTMARLLAKALNCEAGNPSEPCGRCSSCLAIAKGEFPDVIEIDGASNTGVENVRQIREQVRYLPAQGKTKIYIVDEVHMLSQAAFNALLKTLEEPPAHVKFIFATTEIHKIPVTILSRCQRIDFRTVSFDVLRAHLKRVCDDEALNPAPEVLDALAREAQGSVRDAMSLLDQVISYGGHDASLEDFRLALGLVERTLVFDVVESLIERQAEKLLALLRSIDERGFDLVDFATLLLQHFRDLRVVQVDANFVDRSEDEIQRLHRQTEGLDEAHLHRLFDLLVRCAEDVARSETPRLSLEMGLLRMMHAQPAVSVKTLLQRLNGDAHLAQGSMRVREADLSAGPGSSSVAPTGGVSGARAEPQPIVSSSNTAPAVVATDSAAKKKESSNLAITEHVKDIATESAPQVEVVRSGQAVGRWSESDWAKVVAHIRAQRPPIGALLEHAIPSWEGAQTLTLCFAKDSFYADSAREPATKEWIEQRLRSFLNKQVSIKIQHAEDDAPAFRTLASQRDEDAIRIREELESQARGESAVKHAMDILGATLDKVTVFESASKDELENDQRK